MKWKVTPVEQRLLKVYYKRKITDVISDYVNNNTAINDEQLKKYLDILKVVDELEYVF